MIPASGIMEGKSVASSTLSKVPVNGPHAMLGPLLNHVRKCRIIRTYSISSFVAEPRYHPFARNMDMAKEYK